MSLLKHHPDSAMPPSSSFLLLFTTLVFFTPSSLAQNITVGSSLTAAQNSEPWRSPSTDFAFGFQQLQGDPNLFLLSIWFDNIPDKTIVWYPRGIDPVLRGSTLQLDTDGFVLRNPRGEVIYSSNVNQVAYGFMNNAGNLILLAEDSSVVWESFRNPSDTILPTQTIEINESLISRKTQTNFSQGRFHATMNTNGNFVFNTKTVPTNSDFHDEYFSSLTSDANRVVFNDRGLIYIQLRDGSQQFLSPRSIPPLSENYYRATLDFDGVFTLYYHPRNSRGNWSVSVTWPENICANIKGKTGSGACGYNSVCSLENRRPVCNCPTGFSLSDPNNPYGDCKPNSDLLDSDCLNDCLCAVAIFRSERCWKKKLQHSNGRVDNSLNSKAFLKSHS